MYRNPTTIFIIMKFWNRGFSNDCRNDTETMILTQLHVQVTCVRIASLTTLFFEYSTDITKTEEMNDTHSYYHGDVW
jgi:hypothetical protein